MESPEQQARLAQIHQQAQQQVDQSPSLVHSQSLGSESSDPLSRADSPPGVDLDELTPTFESPPKPLDDMLDLNAMLAAAEAQLANDQTNAAAKENEANGLLKKLEHEKASRSLSQARSPQPLQEAMENISHENEFLQAELARCTKELEQQTALVEELKTELQVKNGAAAEDAIEVARAKAAEQARREAERKLHSKEQSLKTVQRKAAVDGQKVQQEIDSFMSHLQDLETENARLQKMLSEQAAAQTLRSTQALVAYLDSNFERLPSQLETGSGMAHVWGVSIEGREDSQGMLLFTERDVECLGSPVSGEQGLAVTAMQAMLARTKAECDKHKERAQQLLLRNRESDQRLLDLQQPKHEIGDMVGKLLKQEKAMVHLRAANDDLTQEIEASKMVKQQLAEQNAVLQRDNWELHQKLEQLGADWAHPR